MGNLPSAPEVLSHVKTKHAGHIDGSGSDVFVPQRNIYPHLHVKKDFVVYSTSSTNHKDLVRGSDDYPNRLSDLVVPAEDGYDHLRAVLNWMAKEAGVGKPHVAAPKKSATPVKAAVKATAKPKAPMRRR